VERRRITLTWFRPRSGVGTLFFGSTLLGAMSSKDGGRAATGGSSSLSDDPVVTILREHTELQVVAERFRQIADALDRGDRTARSDAQEGVEVHQRFLIGIHQRRDALVAAEFGPTADAPLKEAFARCATEHPLAARFQTEVAALLRAKPWTRESGRQLAQLLRAEAERFAEHHRWENESIYHPLRGKLTPAALGRLAAAVRPLAGEAGAAQTELTAWTSHANPTAD
jgi:hypothetical protein